MKRRAAFSLVELLVVVSIIALIFGMVMAMPSGATRQASVEAAAHELAAVIRATRAQAMARGAVYGLTFNIENEPGSSGKILNNRSGGHWYQVLGPDRNTLSEAYQRVYEPRNALRGNYGNIHWSSGFAPAVRPMLEAIRGSFLGERYILPRGQVRFLALADQDNANRDRDQYGRSRFPWSYPRPWFGFWDAGSKRLFPWGGYDTAFKDFRQPDSPLDSSLTGRERFTTADKISYSGFYYEGGDGPITGCVHPSDRLVVDDVNGDGMYRPGTTEKDGFLPDEAFPPSTNNRYPLWRQGEARALINGEWLDALLLFYPDGSVSFAPWLGMRHALSRADYEGNSLVNTEYMTDASKTTRPFAYYNGATKAPPEKQVNQVSFADRCNMLSWRYLVWEPRGWYEASHYDQRTGGFFITLAPDAKDDTDTFASAEAALRTMFPCFRVFIAKTGECRVIEVKRSVPSGTTFLSIASDPDTGKAGPGDIWGPGFWYNGQQGSDPLDGIDADASDPVRTSTTWTDKTAWYTPGGPCGSNGSLIGLPATDFVTADMLTNQKWWLAP